MIGLDTNVLVRFLVQDNAPQGRAAYALITSCTVDRPGFVGREVMVELVWVLERAYGFPREKVADALDALLVAEELVVEAPESVALAAELYRNDGADFADQMIALAAGKSGCETLYTFDRRASRYPGVTLLGLE